MLGLEALMLARIPIAFRAPTLLLIGLVSAWTPIRSAFLAAQGLFALFLIGLGIGRYPHIGPNSVTI